MKQSINKGYPSTLNGHLLRDGIYQGIKKNIKGKKYQGRDRAQQETKLELIGTSCRQAEISAIKLRT